MTFPPFSIFICFNSLELFFSLHSSFSKTVRLPLHVFTSFLMSLQFLSIQNKSQFVVLDHDVLFYRPSPTLLLLFLSFLSPGNARTIEIHLYIYNRILIQHKLIYLHLLASGQQFRSNDFNKTCFDTSLEKRIDTITPTFILHPSPTQINNYDYLIINNNK